MFRRTPAQLSMMESRYLVSPAKRARLERSWAEAFRTHVLPLIDEEVFRPCFCEDNGRPNTSIRLLVGMHLLKEADDLTDEQILDAIEFNIQWQHALGVEPAHAHVCEKTLHNFRHKLIENARAKVVFEQLTEALIKADGLSSVRQRLDSSHVISNIAVLSRLGLFTETVAKFLRELRKDAADKLAKLDDGYTKRYLDREGYFSDANREQARRRLPVVAQDLYALVQAFAADEVVGTWSSYGLLVRLLADQCDVVDGKREDTNVKVKELDEAPEEEDASDEPNAARPEERGEDAAVGVAAGTTPEATPAGDTTGPVTLKEPKNIAGTSLQSPHDPDATYGHKGKGYEVQVAETCVKENPYQVITAIDVNGAHASDQHVTVPIVMGLIMRGLGPEKVLADTNFSSGENIAACGDMGVELVAPVQDPTTPRRPDRWEGPVEGTTPAPPPPAVEGVAAAAPLTRAEESAVDGPTANGVAAPEPDDVKAPIVEEQSAPRLGLDAFRFESTYREVKTCPAGHSPLRHAILDTWPPYQSTFDGRLCASCPLVDRCPTRRTADGDRALRFRDVKAATATRQREQQEPAFKEQYKLRSGIESTNAELKGRHGAGELRVRKNERVVVALALKALALNVKRAVQHHTEALRVESTPDAE